MKLNKKGYMLVEIILASALAFGLAFFIIDLVIRLKNKNDDLLVETLITTDKTIITNKLMSYAELETKDFDCNNLTITGNTVKYDEEVIDIITDYANVGELSCSTAGGKVSITIPVSVSQTPDKDYDITFDYKKLGAQMLTEGFDLASTVPRPPSMVPPHHHIRYLFPHR